ncbi:MAG: VWA domain-containing protein [Planctomycetaceae bacterium]|nr:VWA domain-containing protein [Planctomycetaceae bacterium]
MNSLRFTGDVPLWAGLLLSFAVAVVAWRYYRRESRDQMDLPFPDPFSSGRSRNESRPWPRWLSGRSMAPWLLPLLRSSAFFLGMMILTGPVLRHRATIGDPGLVKIFVDASQSMEMSDKHLSVGRKLRIAEQLGWISVSSVDLSLQSLQDELIAAASQFQKQINDMSSASPERQSSEPPSADITKTQASTDIDDLAAAFQNWAVDFHARLPDVAVDTSQLSAGGEDPAAVPGSLRLPELFQNLVLDAQPVPDAAKTDSDSASSSAERRIQALHHRIDALNIVALAVQTVAELHDDKLLKENDPSIRSALQLFDESTRLQRAVAALEKSESSVLTALREEHEVEVFVLTESDVRRIWQSSADTEFPTNMASEQTGSLTNLTPGLTAADSGTMSSTAGHVDGPTDSQSTAATTSSRQQVHVLLTDGQHNSGPSPLPAAQILGQQQTPCFAVAYGSPVTAPDLILVRAEYPDMVFQKDNVRGSLLLRDSMPSGLPFTVRIISGNDVLWHETFQTGTGAERRVDFEFSVEEPANQLQQSLNGDAIHHTLPLELQAEIVSVTGESEPENNTQPVRLAVVTQRHQLLILDGRSRWETRYLRNAFERDDQWKVDTVIAGPGTHHKTLPRGDGSDMFPRTKEQLLAYDAVILGELPPELLTETEVRWLEEFVSIRGGGLVMIDGHQGQLKRFVDRFSTKLFPVNWLEQPLTELPQPMQLTEAGRSMAALQLVADPSESAGLWSQLPPPRTPISVEALPGSTTLIDTKVGQNSWPLLIQRRYGAGQTLYLASDESWRWRYKTADTYHQRIWNQLLRFVMPRPFNISNDYVSIDTGAISYDEGRQAEIRVQLRTPDGTPAANSTVDAILHKDGREAGIVQLQADADQPGIYRGSTDPMPAGSYDVQIRASGFSDEALQLRGEFVVRPLETPEKKFTNCNDELLTQIADASGGAFLREGDLRRLPDLLRPYSSGRIVETETPLWQSYWWFNAMILMLTIEWFLRKSSGLL